MLSLRIREKPLHPGELTPCVGGCQANIFNYTKDPHKETLLLLVHVQEEWQEWHPQRLAFGGGWRRRWVYRELPDRLMSQSWGETSKGSTGELCSPFWRATTRLPFLPLCVEGCRLPDPAIRIQLLTPIQDPPSPMGYEGQCQNAQPTLTSN